MKKLSLWILLLSLSALTTSCGKDQNSSSESTDTAISDEKVFDNDMFYQEEEKDSHYFDDISNYSSSKDLIQNMYLPIWNDNSSNLTVDDFTYAELYVDKQREEDLSKKVYKTNQLDYLFYGKEMARVVNRADGYAITLPTTQVIKPNLKFSKYRSQYSTKNYTLTVSRENSNTYNNWKTYHDEWLTRYLISDGSATSKRNIQTFFKENKLSYTRESFISSSMISGYDVELISIVIDENENIAHPYYNFAIIKKPNEIKDFTLFVMKSKMEFSKEFDKIVSSFTLLMPYGTHSRTEQFELKVPTYLNIETQKYYKKLIEQEYTDWGIFIHSISKNWGNVEAVRRKTNEFSSSDYMDYDFDILPTYTHCNRLDSLGHFPVEEALELAGGNGFNNKKVLQFTMQFTASNNLSLFNYTPMFDILRGKYDNYFKDLASELKAYGKPVLFRLNNEMNSDWVSYCGEVTLLDPDIFQMTWERMARIFEEEGVDNVLYIFNPTARTYPYCSWGEDLCFLPSLKYVQILGLTYYEYNNYENEDPRSFFEMYQWLYNKNAPQWNSFPAIISEFGCGSGGNHPSGKLYRNALTQAVWVEDMLVSLNYGREDYPSMAQIKGAIWFNANDNYGDRVVNLLVLDKQNTKSTIQAFKEGLAETKKIKNKD